MRRKNTAEWPRIYVCHTYYHVYVTFLKELNLPQKERGRASLVLSGLSINFENLKQRVESTGLFREVLEFDEKREDFFPELAEYRKNTGSFVGESEKPYPVYPQICGTGDSLCAGGFSGVSGYLCLL